MHLLVTAGEAGAISLAMRAAGQCHVQSFNRRHDRTGTLWEGRFKSCLADSDRYLLTVYRYIELNPVRAQMVAAPEPHRWSSVHANLGLRCDPLVTPHPVFQRIASDSLERSMPIVASWTRGCPTTISARSGRICNRNAHGATDASRQWSKGP